MIQAKTNLSAVVRAMVALFSVSSLGQEQLWKLVYEEDFSDGLVNEAAATWNLETYEEPFDTIMDDAGDFYKNDYGPAFTEALESFHTYRKEFTIGQDGWLTASMSLRDSTKNGNFTTAPSFEMDTIGDRNVLRIHTPYHTGGAILRNTNPLPASYRIEYKLLYLDHGGLRNGSIVYPDGRINGYSADGCKTQHPWGEGSNSRGWSGDASAPYCDWQSVRTGAYAYNGFHFLTIVDFADPSPRNNHFWHYRRKVLMDSFSQHTDRIGASAGGQVCNANTQTYYGYNESASFVTLNMWISGLPGTWRPSPGGLTGSSQRFITDCNGRLATRGIQSAGELPTPDDWQTGQYYTFAIERNSSGYTMEASGRFARVGYKKYRFHRPFVVDDEPIWHYNLDADEYDGSYNGDLQQVNWDYGSQTWPDQWPAGSAYPDYFVLGDLYTNVYEGTAAISDIRYYELDESGANCDRTVLLESDTRIDSGEILMFDGFFLYQRTFGSLQLWRGTVQDRTLYWDNGISESIDGATYYTKLQADSNLITWRVAQDGTKTALWKTATVNSGDIFAFVVECEGLGGGVALYNGLPEDGGVSVWQEDSYKNAEQTPTDAPSAASAPTIVEPAGTETPSEAPTCSAEETLMESGAMFNGGETVASASFYLYQDYNGNLELHEGSPTNPGQLVWETGESETTIDQYYTILQGDGTLVTMRMTSYGESSIWSSDVAGDVGDYILVISTCDSMIRVRALDGSTLWESAIVAPTVAPTPQPSGVVGTPSQGNSSNARGRSGFLLFAINFLAGFVSLVVMC
eukprot:Nitzschia sp. Nitz4//scaffold34_size148208//144122//146521//NITZ4_003000-RA/size148208-processed-gene-0.56-mRNA-1//-1//CDS//3329548855//2411//frame0